MPDMDGFTFAEIVREDAQLSKCAIVMVSSAARPGDAEKCRQLGIIRHLTKPVIQSELLNTILDIVGARVVDDILASAADAAPTEQTPLNILLAEDGLINQRVAVGLLKMKGHNVSVANNGKDAVETLQNGNFDVVLMDVQMPEMDGFEATSAIREQEQKSGEHTPIIAMTASAMKGDRERCLEAGMDNYISKPIDPEQLFNLLDTLDSVANESKVSNAEATGSRHETTSQVTSSSDVIDYEIALEQIPGGMEAVLEMSQLLLTECPRLMNELRAALDAGDANCVQRAAHTLKGSASVFGAKYVVEYAARIEKMGRSENLHDAPAAISKLEFEVERLKVAFDEAASASGT